MAEHPGRIAADHPPRGRVQRALTHYDAVAEIEQRQQLEEALRFSAWA